jgi:hypothetical protein
MVKVPDRASARQTLLRVLIYLICDGPTAESVPATVPTAASNSLLAVTYNKADILAETITHNKTILIRFMSKVPSLSSRNKPGWNIDMR